MVLGSAAQARDPHFVRLQVTEGDGVPRLGSGVLVGKQGFLLTAHGVVATALATDSGGQFRLKPNAKIDVRIGSPDGNAVPVTEVGPCQKEALCLLKINEANVATRDIELPNLSCRLLSSEKIILAGWPTSQGAASERIVGSITGGLSEKFRFPFSPPATDLSGAPVYDEGQNLIGIVSPDSTVQLLPLSSLKASLDAMLSCPSGPLFLEEEVLIPHVYSPTAENEMRGASKSLRLQLLVMIERWFVTKSPDGVDTKFLNVLADFLYKGADGDQPNRQEVKKRFEQLDAREWYRSVGAKTVYLTFVFLIRTGNQVHQSRHVVGEVSYNFQSDRVEAIFKDALDEEGQDSPPPTWSTKVGARRVIQKLAKWQREKFLKRVVHAYCVTFNDYHKTVKSAPQRLSDIMQQKWQEHVALQRYQVLYSGTSECDEVYRPEPGPHDDYKERISLWKGSVTPAYTIDTEISLKDRRYEATVTIRHAAGRDYELISNEPIDVTLMSGWDNLANKIATRIMEAWDMRIQSLGKD